MNKLLTYLTGAVSILGLAVPVSAAEFITWSPTRIDDMARWLPVLIAISAVMVPICILVTLTRPFSRRRRGAIGPITTIIVYLATLVQISVMLLCFSIYNHSVDSVNGTGDVSAFATDPILGPGSSDETNPSESEETVPPTTEDPKSLFQPLMSDSSDPANWNMTWEIIVNDEIVESYEREEPISFGDGSEYFSLPGVATFRGNNYRNNPTYGTADITEGEITKVWSHHIGSYNGWIGCGWTGQPLIVQWDAESKAIMNMYDDKKAKEDLVEVIYAKLDGYIHFYDLEDGTATRDPVFIGMNFKGAGALDPRGYPVLYVGGGIYVGNVAPRMYAISLIDGKIIWQYGNAETYNHRAWTAFDSSPLVDAETDTLIWPGECGILYTIKLNTSYDKAAGTFTMEPETPIKTRYTSSYYEDENRYIGYEASACIVDHYLYVSENGGLFHCIDLNTMELVWAQDTKDDSNSSPLFDWDEEGNGYIYTAPSLHWTQNNHAGTISIYKLNAATGEVVWTHEMDCVTHDGISGGVQSSPLLGKAGSNIDGLVIYSVGRSPGAWEGQLVALDKETGEVVWQVTTGNYTWSSPSALYTDDGKAYIFIGNASGVCRLIDGETGELLDTIDLDQTIEASPVIFNDMVVLGTREGVYGFKIS